MSWGINALVAVMSLSCLGCDSNESEVPAGSDPHVSTGAEALVSVATIDQDNKFASAALRREGIRAYIGGSITYVIMVAGQDVQRARVALEKDSIERNYRISFTPSDTIAQ